MDDSRERKAAVLALSKFEEMIITKCKDDPTDILDALTTLKVITESDMDEATASNEYDSILSEFKEKVSENPTLLTEFCTTLRTSENEMVKLITGIIC